VSGKRPGVYEGMHQEMSATPSITILRLLAGIAAGAPFGKRSNITALLLSRCNRLRVRLHHGAKGHLMVRGEDCPLR